MSGFETDLVVQLGADGLWVLYDDLIWRGSDGDVLEVYAGEETDFASTPRLLQALLPSGDPRVVRAATVHDFLCRARNEWYAARRRHLQLMMEWLYSTEDRPMPVAPGEPKFSSVDADRIFKKIMADEGAGWWMQTVGYVGVRLGALKNPARREGWLTAARPALAVAGAFLAGALAILAAVLL